MLTLAPRPRLLGVVLTAAVCWTVFDPYAGAKADEQSLEPSVDLQVPTAPATVDVAGGLRLVYELHATNMRREPIELQRVSVLATPGSAVLAELGAEELARRIGRPGLMPSAPDPLSVGPGQRAIVYFWIDVGSTRPEAVTHRLALSVGEPGGRRTIEVQGPRVPVPGVSQLVIGPPLAGGPWVALYDPLLMGGHRTTVIAVEGQARIPARFAIDWIRAPAPAGGAGKPNAPPDYNGFGADVLSVADARVAQVRDGQPDLRSWRVQAVAEAGAVGREWQLRDPRSRQEPVCRLRAPESGQHHGQARPDGRPRAPDRAAREFGEHVDRSAPTLPCGRRQPHVGRRGQALRLRPVRRARRLPLA